jgi:hypothetical protein
MKYSLWSLFVVVTLTGVLLGARLEYLRRWAVFHEREAKKLSDEFDHEMETGARTMLGLPVSPDILFRNSEKQFYHEKSAELFRKAMYRPWTIVAVPKGVGQ